MKNKALLHLTLFSVLVGCMHSHPREPDNFRKMLDCKQAADNERKLHKEKVLACLPLADNFVKSQETYKLDQDQQLDAFNAAYGIYFYQKDRGANHLEEIFSRFEPTNRTRDMALNVLKKYRSEKKYESAKEFIKNYPEYKLDH